MKTNTAVQKKIWMAVFIVLMNKKIYVHLLLNISIKLLMLPFNLQYMSYYY